MREFGTFLAGAILALCLVLPGIAHAADCDLQQVASLKLTITPGGTITVPIRISGKTYHFTVGVDEAFSLVGPRVRKELNLDKEFYPRMAIFGPGGKTQYIVKLPQVQIGVASFKKYQAFVAAADFPDPAVDGILGLNILDHFDDELDFAAGKFNMYLPHPCAGEVVYWAKRYAVIAFHTNVFGAPSFSATVDGRAVTTAFNTGRAFGDIGMADAEQKLRLDPDDPKLVTVAKPPRGLKKAFRYPFKTLTLGGITVFNPKIFVFPQTTREQCRLVPYDEDFLPPDSNVIGGSACFEPSLLTLGSSVMRKLHLYFAFKEKKLYVTAANAGKSAGNQ